jgi:hypothetical protein
VGKVMIEFLYWCMGFAFFCIGFVALSIAVAVIVNAKIDYQKSKEQK